jgi:hypothetical protein
MGLSQPVIADKNKKVTYADKDASWELYVELNTKMTTQPITQSYNDERTINVNRNHPSK